MQLDSGAKMLNLDKVGPTLVFTDTILLHKRR